MKVSIIGLHHISQTIVLDQEQLSLNNNISSFKESLDNTLIDLSLHLQAQGLETTLIANFSPAPAFMMPLSKLEKHGISVLPDLKDEISYELTVRTLKNDIEFHPQTTLDLATFQHYALERSDAIITTLKSYDAIANLNNYNNGSIISYNTIPSYRALTFIKGLVLKEMPDDGEKSLHNLILGGLGWIAVIQDNTVVFKTLKHQFRLDYTCIDMFLSDFLLIKDHELVNWLRSKTI
ncbi:MAG: hypothetical protein GX038_03920 [Erysipelothrix sp.]|nr:hypothetical protein [Erysipelothrix sp.]